MTRAQSIQIRQPWTLLHERDDEGTAVSQNMLIERAVAAHKIEKQFEVNRDKAFKEFTLCSRPYF